MTDKIGASSTQKRFKDMGDGSYAEVFSAITNNITAKFREAFEVYEPNVAGGRWSETKAVGDLVFVDGNAIAASYLVVSKDPLKAATLTEIETVARFNMPIEMAVGLSMSQRTLGQEFAIEIVSDEEVVSLPDVDIASISQTTTTLTINTVLPHGFVPGKRIGVAGVSDPRLNYPALVVASIPNPTQITCTAGPGGTIPSVTAGPFVGGKVFFRSALGFAENGTSLVFENTTTTNASAYVRSEAGDALPSGTLIGNHSLTVNTTASVQPINAAYTYAFQPSSEFRLLLRADRLQWTGAPVDTLAQATNIVTRTQVIPDPTSTYKLRIRATNNDSLTVPLGQIVSVAKSGSSTATIVFDRPHLLTTSDLFVAYGPRDQTNFANLVVATAVLSVVNATTITAVWGASATATSYGGYAAKVNGGNLMSALGASSITAQSAAVSTTSDGKRVLTLVGSATWGWLIGDSLNAIGIRNATDGGTLEVDGAYRVRNIATVNMELERIDGGTMPPDFVAVNCGGSTIRRTDMRISFARVFDFERERVEILPAPAGDGAGAQSVVVANTVVAAQSTAAAVGTGGTGAWVVRGASHVTADIASAALTTVGGTTSSAVDLTANMGSMQINVDTTSVTGTTPRLITRVQGALDASANFVNIFDIGVITNTNKTHDSPVIPVEFRAIRYVRDLRGTTPSVTHSVNRTMRPFENSRRLRRMIDRIVGLTTTTASSEWLYVAGCVRAQIMCTPVAGLTGAPVLKAQLCQGDPSIAGNWYDIPGAPTLSPSLTASTATAAFEIGNAKFMRLVPTTAATAATADTYELCLSAWE